MKIFIGIPVYNRIDNVKNLAKSLHQIDNTKYHYTISLFDDCSTEIDESDLRELFPSANIIQNKTNLGADRNSYNIFETFLKSEEEVLFVCDSDLILHPDCLNVIEEYMMNTDGVLSLLNSSTHPLKEELNDDLIIKESIGLAGTVFSREVVEDLLGNVEMKYTTMWDWYFCMYLEEKGKRVFVTKNSYVMHMGIDGENSNVMLFDYALNYHPSSEFEIEMKNRLDGQFSEKLFILLDWQKIKILCRKLFRERTRAIFAKIFGKRRLLDLLIARKQRLLEKQRR